ncbi:MAG: thioredoxin family protein [Deltaproteobacteria bacterium]|nr:thioredoxin family protein [Deltaproteobacteria bacterium]
MIDLGAKKCIPCKMMAPIMEKMEKIYKGKAVIAFIDVWEHREPVNAGFMPEKAIVAQLEKIGVK